MIQYGYRPGAPATVKSVPAKAQSWVTYSAITQRPRICWPNNARVALWVCPNILHFDFQPPHDPWINSFARMTAPDVFAYGRQEYGPRVGFWRMLEVLDRHETRCTAVVNTNALIAYPEIREAAKTRKWDYVGHGSSNTRFTFHMSKEEEQNYYRQIVDDIRELTGITIAGMGGPGPQSATENTPDALAHAGLQYYLDLFCDDQPFPINVSNGRLISLPYSIEINDPPFFGMAFEADQFCEALKRQFNVLYEEGAESGRVMCISLHAYLFGQPQRARYLDEALRYIKSFPDVWHATGSEIAAHYMSNCYDAAVGHSAGLEKAK